MLPLQGPLEDAKRLGHGPGNGRALRMNGFGDESSRPIYRDLFNDPYSTDLPIVMPHIYATLGDQLDAGADAQWHDDTDGLTVFVVGGNRDFQGLYDSRDSPLFLVTDRFELRTARWRLNGDTTVDLAFTPTKVWSIFTAIWTPGVSSNCWRNGTLLNSSTTLISNSLGGASDQVICGQYGRMAAAVLYDRALTINELNTVGLYLSLRYGIPWTTIA